MISMSGTTGHDLAGCSKSSFSKAAASEGPRRTLWGDGATNKEHHVCARRRVSEVAGSALRVYGARTTLADFFSILLGSLVLLETTAGTSLPRNFHLVGPTWEHIFLEFRIQYLEL